MSADSRMDNWVPVVVWMRIECGSCGHTDDDIYEFDVPLTESQPMEAYQPGQCPKCGAPIRMHLKRQQP